MATQFDHLLADPTGDFKVSVFFLIAYEVWIMEVAVAN